MQTDWNEAAKEVADEIRKGAELDDALVDVSRDLDCSIAVLRVRFEKAYPNGVMAAPPTEAEMLARRRDAIRQHNANARAEQEAILAFFASRPALKQEVRKNITKFTGKRSCSLQQAKTIADKLSK